MSKLHQPHAAPRWFIIAAIASLLFMLVGCIGYLADVTTASSDIPVDRRALFEARPWWQVATYALAVWIGLGGTVLLLMRKKAAEPLLLASLIAAVITFLPYAVVPGERDNITNGDIAAAVIVIALTSTIFWFSRHSRRRGWLK